MSTFKPILAIEFDAVCHNDTSGWLGENAAVDEPVAGLFSWLETLFDYYDVCIFDNRSSSSTGIKTMQDWFKKHGSDTVFENLTFSSEKPLAVLTIGASCVRFDGTFPTVASLQALKNWNR